MKAIANNDVKVMIPEITENDFRVVMNVICAEILAKASQVPDANGNIQHVTTPKQAHAIAADVLGNRIAKHNCGVSVAVLLAIVANRVSLTQEFEARGFRSQVSANKAGKHDELLSCGSDIPEVKLAVALEEKATKPRATRKAS